MHKHAYPTLAAVAVLTLTGCPSAVVPVTAQQTAPASTIVGPQGIQGVPGLTGIQGPMGLTGPVGPSGVMGPIGPQGAQGVAGQPGRDGVGLPGKDGATGPQGVPGTIITNNLSDAYSTVTPAGQRDEWMMKGMVHSIRSYNDAGNNTNSLNVFSDSYGPARNLGSYQHPDGSGAFSTSDSTGINMVVGSSASEITGGINMTFQHYGYNGDSHPFYVYDNFIPGTVTAGSDEGHAAIRIASLPSATFKATVSSDAGNTLGASSLRFVAPSFCGGSGSTYGIKTCLGAGGWLLDKSDVLYTGLHMTAYAGTTPQHPTLITVAETLTLTPFVTATTSLDAANGDTQTFPVTLPAGFVEPATTTACLSAYGENVAEEVGYTLNGSTITITGHRQPHYVPSGGLMHIALGSCGAAVWRQDAADNGSGSTAYVVLGAIDPHTLMVTQSGGGSRSNGTMDYRKSIQADGATLGAFDVFPAAYVVDVADPTFQPIAQFAPNGIYSYGPLYAHLSTNTVPWFTGKQVEEAYNPSDTYYQQRYQCDTPLADTTIGSACRYTELRGSVQRLDEIVLTNSVDVASRRGRPDILTIRPYNANGGIGTYSHLAGTSIAPTDGWLVSTAYCGESLGDPTLCADHDLWREGGLGHITISGKNKSLTFNMGAYDPAVHFTFQQGLAAYTLHANNGYSGTCKNTVYTDGIATGCAD